MTKTMLQKALKQAEQELSSVSFERDALQKAANQKVSSKRLLKMHIDGVMELEQTITLGDSVRFNNSNDGKSYQLVYVSKEGSDT